MLTSLANVWPQTDHTHTHTLPHSHISWQIRCTLFWYLPTTRIAMETIPILFSPLFLFWQQDGIPQRLVNLSNLALIAFLCVLHICKTYSFTNNRMAWLKAKEKNTEKHPKIQLLQRQKSCGCIICLEKK